MELDNLLWACCVGLVGGILNTKYNDFKFKTLIDAMFNIATSMFLCWIFFEVAMYFLNNKNLSFAIGGFVAFRGVEGINKIVNRAIDKFIDDGFKNE